MSRTYRHLPYDVAFEKVMGVPLEEKVVTKNLTLEQFLSDVKQEGTHLRSPQRIELKNRKYSTPESREYLRVENFSHIEKVGSAAILPVNFYEKTGKKNAFRFKTEREHKEYESKHGDNVHFAHVHNAYSAYNARSVYDAHDADIDKNIEELFTFGQKDHEEPLNMSDFLGNNLVAKKFGEYTYFYSIIQNTKSLPYWVFNFNVSKFNHVDPFVNMEKYQQLQDYAESHFYYFFAIVFRTKHDNFDVSRIVENFSPYYLRNPAERYEIDSLTAKSYSEKKIYPFKNHKKRRIQERANITEGLKLFRNGNVHCLDIDFDKDLGKWDS